MNPDCHEWEVLWEEGDVSCRKCLICGEEAIFHAKDDAALVAAALGLKASAWAQAEVHLTERKFNASINGKQVLKDGRRVDDEHELGS